ncbi:MAG TPA: ribosome silencing factor [Anaerolineaceae bacterium]|nr:ribosome silencing factor [Anaerolineaceae bacterium]HPN50611.1 ribosome silencing factor [Anaerolineaceae bacterium]
MRCPLNTQDVNRTIINALEEKKGEDILLMDVHEVASFTDYFVICNGTSDRMIDSLAEAVMIKVKQEHQINSKPQGQSAGGWVVLDLGNTVVHLFSPDQRNYYRLEELWEHGKVLLRLK